MKALYMQNAKELFAMGYRREDENRVTIRTTLKRAGLATTVALRRTGLGL